MKLSKFKADGFAAIRSRLGLSQRQLAEQLGVSKATIGMAETGRRNMPSPALFKMAELEIKMAATMLLRTAGSVSKTTMDLPVQASCKSIEVRELQCERQIQRLTKLLETKTAQYKKFYEQLQLLDGMLEKEPGERGMFTLDMQLHRDRIWQQLERCSLPVQRLLRNKIALLSAELYINKSLRQQILEDFQGKRSMAKS